MVEVIELLRQTVTASDIKYVAIVDDVFDTPTIKSEDAGAFLDFLEKGDETRVYAEIEKDVWTEAIAAVRKNESDDSAQVADVLEKLYKKYIETGERKCDPAGLFARDRDANLGFLRPLLELLSSCGSLEIRKFGSAPEEALEAEMPDLVLVDLFLNPAMSPTAELDEEVAQDAADKSMKRVLPLLKKNPAVILMSSHGERGLREADNYRFNLNNRVFASRFGFVDKGQVQKDSINGFKVEVAARDTLLDIFQTYKFGKALSEAMTRWLEGVTRAVEDMGKDVRSLQLKEISYLVQFRLATEGQGLEEYLEWFFGEALLDYIGRTLDSSHDGNSLEVGLGPVAASGIDGGFEPTTSVAKMYHRVRVENKRTRARKNFRLGDLYLQKGRGRVVAVMTPDCDLVLRKGEKKEEVRNAEHLLLVPGQITDLEKTSASVGDFLMIGDTPHNVQWSYKKLFTAPFTGTFLKAGQSGDDFEYIGALRPLYAQEIQAHLLHHVGRVGVAVPPVIGMPAIATIVVRTSSALKEISAQGTTFNCSLVPGRASDQKSRVVFDREVIRKIQAALINMPVGDLIEGSAAKVEALNRENAASVEIALKSGPEIGTELSTGITLATGKRKIDGPWCAIYITPVTGQAVAKKTRPRIAPAPAINETTALAAPAVGLVEPEAPVLTQEPLTAARTTADLQDTKPPEA